jgi:hypothetical protein
MNLTHVTVILFVAVKKGTKTKRIFGEACLPTWGMDSRHQYV